MAESLRDIDGLGLADLKLLLLQVLEENARLKNSIAALRDETANLGILFAHQQLDPQLDKHILFRGIQLERHHRVERLVVQKQPRPAFKLKALEASG